jgi:hypothetical protein
VPGLLWTGAVLAAQPATLRVDYVHSGNALQDHYALERVLVEALPWPGAMAQTIDTLALGAYFFDVVDPASGRVLYSRGYSSVFGEWRTTEEAQRLDRAFGESLRFPMPEQPVRVRVYARDDRNQLSMVWTVDIDPASIEVAHKPLALGTEPVAIREHGPPERKVDLLILGDGYTEAERPRFLADARRLTEELLATQPFKQRAQDFNVRALMVATPESGISRPSTGQHRASALGTRYDIFGSERYVLTLDNRALRDIAQHAPYEFIEILFNGETYGGGGIYGQYSTAAAGSEWAPYVVVHEFGHHFAALADEYYTSPVSYAPASGRREPWETNVTAQTDRAKLKWGALVEADTPLPTPWPKAEFEAFQRENQAERKKLREQRRPESEMNALFRREQAHVEGLFSTAPHRDRVGLFEGANYEATGYYRSEMNCLMFTRSERFCRVCAQSIEAVIDQYSSR